MCIKYLWSKYIPCENIISFMNEIKFTSSIVHIYIYIYIYIYNIISYIRHLSKIQLRRDQITININIFIRSSLLKLSKNNQSFVAFVEIRTKAFNGAKLESHV